jgi:hypothetical protein
LRREERAWRGLRAIVIRQGDRLSLPERLAAAAAPLLAKPAGAAQSVPVVEPGQNRQLASWRLFRQASEAGPQQHLRLQLEGWAVLAWSAGAAGEVAFDLELAP